MFRPQPSHAPDAFDLGARPEAPAIEGMPLAGSTIGLGLPVDVPAGVTLGTAYRLGTRWIPLDEAALPVEPEADDVTALVARESAASLVDVRPATVAGPRLAALVPLPAAAGRYRLEVTIHDADGVALRYEVQASIPAVVVHVGGPGAAWLDAPPALFVTAGTLTSIRVLVTNGEAEPWGTCAPVARRFGPDDAGACPVVRLVGRWIAVGGSGAAVPMSHVLAQPAASAQAEWLAGPVPSEPGTYLLVASLERAIGTGPPQVLGRPATIIVAVMAAPLVPTPPGN